MNRQRRQQLIDTFPQMAPDARPMDPALNTTVQAILDAERIEAGTHGRDNSALFDPTWSPDMWARANEVTRELRNALAANRIRYDSFDYDLDHRIDTDNPPRDAVFIYHVGCREILVCCRAGSSHDERRLRGPDYFGGALRMYQQIDDYWNYGAYSNNPTYGADYELRCNVNIAADCTAPLSPDVNDYHGGTTRLMVVRRGQFMLLFRCCRVCEELAGKIADTNFKISVMEAQAALPPGARIDPLSPVPPRP